MHDVNKHHAWTRYNLATAYTSNRHVQRSGPRKGAYVRRCGPRRLAPWNRRCSKTFFVSCRKKSLCWRLCVPRIWKHACGQEQAPKDTKQMQSEPSIIEFTIRLRKQWEVWSVECEVWSLDSEECSVQCEVWSVEGRTRSGQGIFEL